MLETLLRTEQLPNVTRRKERLMAELDFARQLVEREENAAFLPLVEQAVSQVQEAEEQGGFSEKLVEQIEDKLSPLKEKAKAYTLLCQAHAHIDMNWQWSYDETVMTTLDTFQTMLDILKEYPQFHFAQSQASVYQIVEKYAPHMLEEIRQYVKEGRWEVTASTWVEADKNMPVGESFARHALYTKSYLANLLELDPDTLTIDFEPDTFGHSRNIPEIDTKAGVKYYYHCRGNDKGHYLYRWRAPSGAELLVYREPFFYNSAIDSKIGASVLELAEKTGCKTVLRVYGVGDHGGGPTRRDIERLLEMSQWPIFPQVRFGTLRQYFAEAEKIRDSLPVEDGEINFICDGCYTSQSRIKDGNVRGERGLKEAETFSALAAAAAEYAPRSFRPAWEQVLFNQFHDILTGSGVIHTREYACGQYQEVQAAIRSGRKQALSAIAQKIDTSGLEVSQNASCSFGAGSGHAQGETGSGPLRIYHLFHSGAQPFSGGAELFLWDYEGEMDRLYFQNSKGERIPHQLLEQGGYWGHSYHKVLLQVDIPAFGYETVVTAQDPAKRCFVEYPEMRRQQEEYFVLENEYVRAVVDHKSGAIVSLFDKSTGREKLDGARGGARLCILDESTSKSICNWGNSMSSWFVGATKRVEPVSEAEVFSGVSGELRNSIKWKAKLRDSSFEVEIGLDKESRDLDFTVTCDWREFGCTQERIPTLAFCAPLAGEVKSYLYDVPFGVLEREPKKLDRPGNSFAASDTGVAVISEARYGFYCDENSICLKLIRSSTDPDPIPEISVHTMRFSLCLPKTMERQNLVRQAQGKYVPPQVLSGRCHTGSLALSGGFLSQEGTAVISALKMAEAISGGWVLRLYEVCGKDSQETFTFPNLVKRAYFTDVTECRTLEEIPAEGNRIHLRLPPYQVATIVIEF